MAVINEDDKSLFILAGNGPYLNRGCEAIVRGTVNILRQCFDKPKFVCVSHFNSKEEFEEQRKNESDEDIIHLQSRRLNKREAISKFYRAETWKYLFHLAFKDRQLGYFLYDDILQLLPDAQAVLSIGGDNYSLDYGKPYMFTLLDDIVLNRDAPLVIWGASVGPFSKIPAYEEYMSHHLREITGIFARESITTDYLESIGLTENVYPVADPAFLMDSVEPGGIDDEIHIDDEAIGLNLSPLIARYVTGGNLDVWASKAASIIDSVAKTTEMPIYLIPHVTTPTSNDYSFMQQALSQIDSRKKDIFLVPPKYNATETKWIISKMSLFAGARTHSTIAALSSNVPTLSFAYSIKAQGINRDIFGHTRYCIDSAELSTENVSKQIKSMLDEKVSIRCELENEIPKIQSAALSAGVELKRLIEAV